MKVTPELSHPKRGTNCCICPSLQKMDLPRVLSSSVAPGVAKVDWRRQLQREFGADLD